MIVLSSKDFLEVKTASLVADYDREILANLYQPIIGFTAFAVYQSLLTEANNQKISSMINHDEFFNKMKITAGQFVDARKLLEGIGLMKTFVSDTKGVKIYRYEIYAPRNPKDFFENALLYGMLIQSIGEAQALKLKNIYRLETSLDVGQEISSSFVDAYKPDFDDPAFKKALISSPNIITRTGAKIDSQFSFEKFFETLAKVSQIKSESFTKKDMKEIDRLATLYGLDETAAANGVAQIYDPLAGKGKHIDFARLASIYQDETNYNYLAARRNGNKVNTVSGNSDLANKINIMEKVSPKDYLSILQNGSKPAGSDLRLINDISANFHLPNSVINVVIEYTLAMNSNILSRGYSEKVAASLAREGVDNAVDAMNFLNKVSRKKKPVEEVKQEEVEEQPEIEIKSAEETDSGLDWNSLIDEIDEGGSDGKA